MTCTFKKTTKAKFLIVKKKASRIVGWGLRRFSKIVCRKVEAKGRTTYNEVADDIMAELRSAVNNGELVGFDEKNIRRRVYDAFNVLMAIDVIVKDKKEVKWTGFRSGRSEQLNKLEEVRLELLSRIGKKTNFLKELENQFVDLQNLMLQNQIRQKSHNSSEGVNLPFLLVKTSPKATVEIQISENLQLVHFDFNGTPFTLHDDASILKAMRLRTEAERIDHTIESSLDCSNTSL
ncbi:transcription factor-like protein DPB isoform X2 [Ananas comosus]|uniref:Transcription factor-like protein DPB isoform X2 n=1 Tax=Ananas comosus TaxID=4615 RepID=A0A6P5GEN6_ANACO|nr:transcription factor-like protein DPB isoform X2 [Ananas comosus]XP_020106338.1 transcription factor-like protein DPB isoform X2 [Ananas comosus]